MEEEGWFTIDRVRAFVSLLNNDDIIYACKEQALLLGILQF